jgi:hypothetical protein
MNCAGPPNPVEAGMNEVLGGWSGAGWWQPCSEVCTAGTTFFFFFFLLLCHCCGCGLVAAVH